MKHNAHNETTGQFAGEVCNRNGCTGVIIKGDGDGGCSCHINPPCGYCTTPHEECPVCGWRAVDDEAWYNELLVRPAAPKGAYAEWRPRPLDPTRISYRVKSHTNSSQICEGIAPFGTSADDIVKQVKGTFGGRFDYFDKGTPETVVRFKYIAYTD